MQIQTGLGLYRSHRVIQCSPLRDPQCEPAQHRQASNTLIGHYQEMSSWTTSP